MFIGEIHKSRHQNLCSLCVVLLISLCLIESFRLSFCAQESMNAGIPSKLVSPLYLIGILCGLLVRVTQAQDSVAADQGTNGLLRTITIRAEVPQGVDTVFITGNRPEIGNWNPHGLAMTGSGTNRIAVLRLPMGTSLEYKFTLGSWDREGLGPSGTIEPNHRLIVETNQEVTIVIPGFRKGLAEYLDDWGGSGVLGRLEYWKEMPSKFLNSVRNVEIWTPPDYEENSTNRYDVLYMQDGQNLFDPRIANTCGLGCG